MNALKHFLATWFIIILLNQFFIFGACFAPYCILAALPHTGVIAFFIIMFFRKMNKVEEGEASTEKPTALDTLLERGRPALTGSVSNLETSPVPAPVPSVSQKIEGALRLSLIHI